MMVYRGQSLSFMGLVRRKSRVSFTARILALALLVPTHLEARFLQGEVDEIDREDGLLAETYGDELRYKDRVGRLC